MMLFVCLALLQIVDINGQCAQKTDSVRIACLPPIYQMMPYGSYCHIAGYGHERNGNLDHLFNASSINVINVVLNVSEIFCNDHKLKVCT